MDNLIDDILDNGIKEIQSSQRIPLPSAITYEYNSNNALVNNDYNVPIRKGKNKIIDKTMSLLKRNKTHQNSRCNNNDDINIVKRRSSNNNISNRSNIRESSKDRISKSIATDNTIKKAKLINWEKKFEELRQKAEEAKKSLVNERKKGKELEKQFNRLNKKEQQYNELIDVNQKMLQTNESLYRKVEANDRIVQEQEEIINSLQLEIKRYMGVYENNKPKKR